MKIPFDVLSSILKKNSVFQMKSPEQSSNLLGRPKFLLSDMMPESGRLYVSDPETFRLTEAHLPHTSALLSTQEPAALLNRIQDIYDHLESCEEDLAQSAATGDMREMLDEVEVLLGNPAILCKSSYAIVACSGEIFSNPSLAPLRGTHLPYEYVNTMQRDPKFAEKSAKTSPYRFQLPATSDQALGVNLLVEADIKYHLMVLPCLRPLDDSDCFLMTLCAKYVDQMVRNTVIANRISDPSGRRERLIELFRSVVETENTDLTVLEQGFTSLGWLPRHQYSCLAIRLGTPDYLDHTAELLCNQLESLLPSSCVFAHMGTIFVLLNITLSGTSLQKNLDNCIYFLRDNDLRTGVSNLFTGFTELRNYHKQACIALDFAARPQSYLWVRHFSDVVLDYILEQSNRELPLHLICSQQILNMRQYDEEHQTDFYETLQCYIRNHFNAVQTAKELQIHRSTFLYRMERLQTLFELDLDQEDSLLYILLSMKMLDLSKTMTLHDQS